jgi:hypothetical protein
MHCLQALQEREEAVSNGKLATIIFIRDRNAQGHEVRRVFCRSVHSVAAAGGSGEAAC